METTWQFFQANFGQVLLATVGFFLVRTLNRLERAVDHMDRKVDDHDRRLSNIEGWRGAQTR